MAFVVQVAKDLRERPRGGDREGADLIAPHLVMAGPEGDGGEEKEGDHQRRRGAP